MGELVTALPQYHTLRKKLSIQKNSEANKQKLVDFYTDKKFEIVTSELGSTKVYPDADSFVWLRDSKTESGVLRLIVDSQSAEKSEALLSEALELLKK